MESDLYVMVYVQLFLGNISEVETIFLSALMICYHEEYIARLLDGRLQTKFSSVRIQYMIKVLCWAWVQVQQMWKLKVQLNSTGVDQQVET